jgi:MoxR-like ATPase
MLKMDDNNTPITTDPIFTNRLNLDALTQASYSVRAELSKVLVGQHKMVDLILIALLADGHILIEGVPGVAKTLTAKLIAKVVDINFSRLQFTPDLMPSDVLGTSVFNPKEGNFEYKKGAIFSNIVLIDEINRAPAKTQAALFEVMEERQVTADGVTRKMDEPFVVLATQNPIEQEGTYRLPEAQLDRFLFKIDVKYPSLAEEIQLLTQQQHSNATNVLDAVNKVLSANDISQFRALIAQVIIEDKLIEYIAQIVGETRSNASLYLGASPRASLAIMRASKANAALKGRDFVTPDDVYEVAPSILRHRVVLTPEKEMEGINVDNVIDSIIKQISVPR